MTNILQVLMPWKFNGCHTLFVIDHVKKHVTFIDFTLTQYWCKQCHTRGLRKRLSWPQRNIRLLTTRNVLDGEREMCPWAISSIFWWLSVQHILSGLLYAKWWMKCKSTRRYDSILSTFFLCTNIFV